MQSSRKLQQSVKSKGDRFIPRRNLMNANVLNIKKHTNYDMIYKVSENPNESPKYCNFAYSTLKKISYIESLQDTLLGDEKRVLNFFDKKNKENKQKTKQKETSGWPVKARITNLIKAPARIIDTIEMTTFTSLENICYQTLDWSSKGIFTNIKHGRLYIWDYKDQELEPILLMKTVINNCVRWNHSGTHLAISSALRTISVYDSKLNKVHKNCCECVISVMKSCSIVTVAWTKSNKLYATCSNGFLTVWSANLNVLHYSFCSKNVAVKIDFSCNEKYLTELCRNGCLRLHTNEGKKFYAQWIQAGLKTFAWHPWKESLIALGTDTGNLSLLNVENHQLISYIIPSDEIMGVDALTFNPISAELVVSYHKQINDEKETNIIRVLSDLHTTVDVINWYNGRVNYLLWGENGTALAAAGQVVTWCVWNFFGEETDNIKKKLKQKRGPSSSVLDLNGFSICIR